MMWLRAGLASAGVDVAGLNMAQAKDIMTGLVATNRWPATKEWLDMRYPIFATDDPITLLGKLF